MCQFTQEDILNKVKSAISTALRIDPRVIGDLNLATSMDAEFNGVSLGDAVWEAADILSKRKNHEQISDAILKYGKTNSTLGTFYTSVLNGVKKMGTPKKAKNNYDVVKSELRMLESAGQKRALSKGCQDILAYQR